MTPLIRLSLLMSVIVLALLAWALVNPLPQKATSRAPQQQVEAPPEPEPTGGFSAPVQEFLPFAAGTPGQDVPPIGLGHEYTAEGILKLAAALESLVPDADHAARRQLTDFAVQGDQLRRSRSSLEHADIVRRVFMSTVDFVGRATGQEISELSRAARAIDPDRTLLPQHEHVRQFFIAAAQILREASRPSRTDVHGGST